LKEIIKEKNHNLIIYQIQKNKNLNNYRSNNDNLRNKQINMNIFNKKEIDISIKEFEKAFPSPPKIEISENKHKKKNRSYERIPNYIK